MHENKVYLITSGSAVIEFMTSKQEMIKSLIQGLSLLETETYPLKMGEKFTAWLHHVSLSLEAANMQNELKIWKESISIWHSPHNVIIQLPSLIQISSAKATLLGFLNNLGNENKLFPIDNKTNEIMFHYLDLLHPKIKEASNQLFLDGHYHQAIEAAIKAINQYIRDKTGLKSDSADLINTAFTADKDISKRVLVFSDLSTETLRNEQIGFAEMLKGFTKGVRNVLAHSPAKPEDPQKAFEYLTMASLFCRRIDDTYKENP